MMGVVLFMYEIKPWLDTIEGLQQLCDDISKIFEHTVDANLLDLFFKSTETKNQLTLNIHKVKETEERSALTQFNNLCNETENENYLYIDFNESAQNHTFLDKFYLIEIQESRGIILHDKLDYELLEEAVLRKLCIVPKDLNDRRVVCTMGSKLAVINNNQFEQITQSISNRNDEEYVSKHIIKQIVQMNQFKLSQNKL